MKIQEQLQSYWKLLSQKVTELNLDSASLDLNFSSLSPKQKLCSATLSSFTTVLHSCEMHFVIRMRMSTAPACNEGQLLVGFERRVLVILCDLTRLKTSKLQLIK